MKLNKRELRILYTTVTVAMAFVGYQYVFDPIYTQYTTQSNDVEKEYKTYVANRAVIAKTDQIEEQFKRIEAQFPKEEQGKTPEAAFSEAVEAASTGIIGQRPSSIEPPTSEDIKDVEGYHFLNLNMRVIGELSKIATLLKGFDQKGFLIKNITLYHSKGPDVPELIADITLARIVKNEEVDDSSGPKKRGTQHVHKGSAS